MLVCLLFVCLSVSLPFCLCVCLFVGVCLPCRVLSICLPLCLRLFGCPAVRLSVVVSESVCMCVRLPACKQATYNQLNNQTVVMAESKHQTEEKALHRKGKALYDLNRFEEAARTSESLWVWLGVVSFALFLLLFFVTLCLVCCLLVLSSCCAAWRVYTKSKALNHSRTTLSNTERRERERETRYFSISQEQFPFTGPTSTHGNR